MRVLMPMTSTATKERGSRSRDRKPSSAAPAKAKPAARTRERASGQGGKRLAAAFDTVSATPALAEARHRLLRAGEAWARSGDEVAAAIESDAALAIQVMRAANNGGGPHGRTRGVRQAVDILTVSRIRDIVDGVNTYDPFEHPNAQADHHERFRRHAVATRHAAERIADLARLAERDELAIAPLLYELPHSGAALKRNTDPCPLSDREVDALRGLAEGKVYKQIASELSLSVSTIRTHLHNVYRKIGAVDRA